VEWKAPRVNVVEFLAEESGVMGANETDDVAAKGPRYLAALSSLPEELKPIYKDFVEEYKFHALTHYGRAWVAYDIIADLVRSGWRARRTVDEHAPKG
jgi:hypothetical protein